MTVSVDWCTGKRVHAGSGSRTVTHRGENEAQIDYDVSFFLNINHENIHYVPTYGQQNIKLNLMLLWWRCSSGYIRTKALLLTVHKTSLLFKFSFRFKRGQ